jgi:hypothetical protein
MDGKVTDMTHLGIKHRLRIKQFLTSTGVSLWALGFAGTAVQAQDSNFGTFTLNAKTLASVVNGATGGSTSLPAITTNSDRNDNQCLGFGDPKPDHIMKLTRKVDRLKLQVDSGGKDTTLVIMGPDGDFRCADDFGGGKDAGMDDLDWKSGTYQVWVGSVVPGARRDYRLTVQGF